MTDDETALSRNSTFFRRSNLHVDISICRATATRHIKCSLCSAIVSPGKIFWRGFIDEGEDLLWICTDHIPLNTIGMKTESGLDESSFSFVRPIFINVKQDLIPALIADWNVVYGISAEEFEEFVCDRLLTMGLQAFRTGRSNEKDGGIDIIFWTAGPLRVLGAVQVKHHCSLDRHTGPNVVREFAGVIAAHRFNVGMIVTNTEFTPDAKWFAQQKGALQLRAANAIQRWTRDDFELESWNTASRTVELCPGVEVQLPQFL